MKIIKILIVCGMFASPVSANDVEITPPQNFIESKAAAVQSIYFDTTNDLYCDCPITWRGVKSSGLIDVEACGYKI